MLVAPTFAVGATPEVTRSMAARTMADWYAMGGPAMHALVLCSVLILAIVLERCHALRRRAFVPKVLARSLREAIDVGNRHEIKRLVEEDHSVLADLARTALEGQHARERLEAEGAAAAHQAQRNLPLLATLGNLATMVGLLGTVLGMVEAFDVIAQSGTGDARIVAGGIFRALVTTAAGLTIGIGALGAHALFNRRATDFIVALESLVTEVAEQANRPNLRLDEREAVEIL
jgi:biopolymer transport protein ExbB